LRNARSCVFYRLRAGVLGLAAIVTSGCSSTIHEEANIGGVDTLSVDAKQRLVLVGNRDALDNVPQVRVECAEPSPDALVARAAAIAAGVDINGGSGNASGGGTIGGGISETAASIGIRDHTIQMMRDAYYRMCEAYLNGAISEPSYRNMILNADTFMVVASALQTLGSNPVAAPAAISAGAVTATTGSDGRSVTVKSEKALLAVGDGNGSTDTNIVIKTNSAANARISAENATAAARILKEYLAYRENLGRALKRADKADERKAGLR
jgi:hypothetical protein